MSKPRNAFVTFLLLFSCSVAASEHDLPSYVLPPGMDPEAVLGVSPTFEAELDELLGGQAEFILRDQYPEYSPFPDARNGGSWFGNPDGSPDFRDYGQANFVYVEIGGEVVCIQVSSSERLDDYFPVFPFTQE